MFVALLAFVFIILVLGVLSLRGFGDSINEVQASQKAGRERGYVNRAVACMDIINDEEIELTGECVDPEIAAYYPPAICMLLPERVPGCSSRATVVD